MSLGRACRRTPAPMGADIAVLYAMRAGGRVRATAPAETASTDRTVKVTWLDGCTTVLRRRISQPNLQMSPTKNWLVNYRSGSGCARGFVLMSDFLISNIS